MSIPDAIDRKVAADLLGKTDLVKVNIAAAIIASGAPIDSEISNQARLEFWENKDDFTFETVLNYTWWLASFVILSDAARQTLECRNLRSRYADLAT